MFPNSLNWVPHPMIHWAMILNLRILFNFRPIFLSPNLVLFGTNESGVEIN